VRFIYSRETTTKKWRIGRLKSKSGYAMRAVSVLLTLTVITPTATVNNNPITLGPTTRKADVRGGDVWREADIRGRDVRSHGKKDILASTTATPIPRYPTRQDAIDAT